jgi:hypothetical protein
LDLSHRLHGFTKPDLVFEDFGFGEEWRAGIHCSSWDQADDFSAVDLDAETIGFAADCVLDDGHSCHFIIN